MIKKFFFLFGVLLLTLPFLLAIKKVWNDDPFEKINEDLLHNPSAAGKKAVFQVLDGSQYSNKVYPWLGFPVTIVHEDELLGEGDNFSHPPDEFRIKETLLKYQNEKRLILQIDSWKIEADNNDNTSSSHADWYLLVLKWGHEILPGVNLGFFDMPYSPWFALQKPDVRMREYQKTLKKLMPVLKASDSLYPSFFVQYGDSEHLFYTMITQLYIAKSLAKRVYPIFWQKGRLTDTVRQIVLPIELIKRECRFAKKYADGMVWWSAPGDQWEDEWYTGVKEVCFD